MAFFKSIKKGVLCISVALAVIGYFLIVKGKESIEIAVAILAYVLMFAGVIEAIRYFVSDVEDRYKKNGFVLGLFVLVAGLAILLFKKVIIDMAELILGIVMIISGIYKIQDLIDSKRINHSHFGIYITLVIICLAFGVLIILNPFKEELLYLVIGVGLMFAGVTDFISNIYLAIANAIKIGKEKKEELEKELAEKEKQEKEKKEKESVKQEEETDETTDSHMTRIDL